MNGTTFCGYTPQYTGLQKLHEELSGKGLQIIGFPCNQFGEQEPGSNAEIADFCDKKYHVTFPIYEKVEVNGSKVHPVYAFLKSAAKVDNIKWNFEKFLVDKNGNVVKHAKSGATPEQLKADIEKLLAQ